MLSNRAAFAALAVTCIAAAAGGGYLASRQSPELATQPAVSAAPEQKPVAQPVQETEAVVGDPDPIPPAPPAPAPAPVKVANARPAAPRGTVAPAGPSARERSASASSAPVRQPPVLERSWPSGAASGTPPPPQAPAIETPAPAPVEDRAAAEPTRAPAPPERSFEELIVSPDSVIGLQNETALSSERARVEDRVEARVVRDVRVGNQVAIPAGSRAVGSVMLVERGGRFKERARLGIRFHTLVLADGTRMPITTETIYRYGDAPGNSSTAKIGGGAVAGAILGAILGGAKGAAVGATTGAGAGTAAVVAGDRSAAELPVGTEVTARILSPVTVTVEK